MASRKTESVEILYSALTVESHKFILSLGTRIIAIVARKALHA